VPAVAAAVALFDLAEGQIRSSWTTSSPLARGRQRSTAFKTIWPLSFMNPSGSTKPERVNGTGFSPG
jgi:hypothetical protein